MVKTHRLFHSYAKKIVENPKTSVLLATAKGATVAVALLEYKQYKEKYDKDTIRSGSHTSPAKSIAEDMGISGLVTASTFFGLKYAYLKHPNWHPKAEKSAGKGPDGEEGESVDGRKRSACEQRGIAEGMGPDGGRFYCFK
jgi:hypothetical protein